MGEASGGVPIQGVELVRADLISSKVALPMRHQMQLNQLKRREIITLLGGAAAWPLVVRAQEARRLPTIGFLGTDALGWSPWTAAFLQRLRELGFVEGRNLVNLRKISRGQNRWTISFAPEGC